MAQFKPIPIMLASAALVAMAGCATVANTVGESWSTAMVGSQEVPGPGDPTATGTARITADSTTDQICYDLTVQGIPNPTAAHIHKGVRGVAGPVVVPLMPPVGGHSKACVGVDKQLAAAIIADPSGFYVNVHDADHPKGAIRGQLPRH